MDKKYIIAIVIAVLALYGAFWLGRRFVLAPEIQEHVPSGMQEISVAAPVITAVFAGGSF
ncbi:MAG: hypothetical protein ACYCZ7_01635 [Minisyncoccota bacterium]